MRAWFSWASPNQCTSFGKMGWHIARELAHVTDIAKTPEEADWQMYFGPPLYAQRRLWKRRCSRVAWYTVWEDPAVPHSHVERLNTADVIVVPSRWCATIYRDAGVSVPCYIVPHGVDVGAYQYIERPDRRTFTYLWIGVCAGHIRRLEEGARRTGDRKRGWLVRHCFEALELPSDARLIIKSVPWPSGAMNFQYRTRTGSTICEISAWCTERQLLDLYREADVLVWPTWGEGFGVPPMEAAATGLPTLLPPYSGITEYYDPAWCIPLPYHVGRIWRGYRHRGAIIHPDDLCAAMQWAYDNRDVVRAMGREGASRASSWWSWDKAARPALGRLAQHFETGGDNR